MKFPVPERRRLLFIMLVLSVLCLAGACQPTPEKEIIVGKDQDEMISAAVQTPEASEDAEPAFSLSDMQVPQAYTFSTTGADGNLTVNVDAAVRMPDADALPTAKVKPGTFTQEMVSGMLDYLFGATPYYEYDRRITKDGYQEMILNYQKNLADKNIDEEGKALYQQEIEKLREEMAEAPEELEPRRLSDGIMTPDSGYDFIEVQSEDSKGYTIAHFSCSATQGKINTTSQAEMGMLEESHLFYSNYSSEDDEYYNYTMDGAQRVYDDTDIPDDLKEKLGVSLADAKSQVKSLLSAAGIDDMMCSAAFVVDDHGTGHVDDYSGVASDWAYMLFYTRSVNGVSVLPTSEFAQNMSDDYDYVWVYENMQVIVTKGGIVDISWYSPCSVTEMVTDNTNIIGFDEAADIFEKKILTFYEARIDAYGFKSISIDIDNVELGLLRIKQQNVGDTAAGLYVPVWAFYGTVATTYPDGYVGYDHGCDFPDKPYIVLAINAINGSIIDVAKGY